jgi:hypothetical protein
MSDKRRNLQARVSAAAERDGCELTGALDVDRRIDHNRGLAERTRNPVYIWRAIALCLRPRMGAPRSLPEWCLEYLAKSAGNIDDIVWDRNIDAKAALAHIPHALDLVRQGRNEILMARRLSLDEALIDMQCRAITGSAEKPPVTRDAALKKWGTLGLAVGKAGPIADAPGVVARVDKLVPALSGEHAIRAAGKKRAKALKLLGRKLPAVR